MIRRRRITFLFTSNSLRYYPWFDVAADVLITLGRLCTKSSGSAITVHRHDCSLLDLERRPHAQVRLLHAMVLVWQCYGTDRVRPDV